MKLKIRRHTTHQSSTDFQKTAETRLAVVALIIKQMIRNHDVVWDLESVR